MGSCFEGSSTKQGLDLTESSLNGPKRTQEWHEAVGPKNAENGETGRGLHPKTLRKGGVARPSALPKRKSHEMADEEKEEARSIGGSSTPDKRRRRSNLHAAPCHVLTPTEVRRRSHLKNPPRKW